MKGGRLPRCDSTVAAAENKIRRAFRLVVALSLFAPLIAVSHASAAEPPPGSVVIDGFDRPDAPTLGSTETGQAWATWQGSGRVVAGTAEAPGGEYTLAVVDSTTAVGRASVTVSTLSGEFWLIVRASTTGNYWRFGRWQGGTYQLQQVRSSALGAPAVTTAATVTPAVGDRLSCQLGTGLSCSVNGTTVATTADTHNAAATYMGWAAGAGAAARFDDMAVTTPPPAPDLGVGVAAASSAATGAPVSWTVTVKNNGTRTATTSNVGLSLSAALANAGVTSSTGTCIGAGTSWTCALGDRAVNSTATITLSATAPSTTATLTLTATAASAEEDANPADNSASAAISVRAPPPPGSVVIDGFDRPDAPTLGSTETGQAWATWQGSGRVVAGTAEAPGGEYTLAVVDSTTAVGRASVTVSTLSGEFWLIVRASTTGNYWRFGRWQGGTYQLQQVRSSALGAPAVTTAATVTPAVGDRLSCQLGTGLSCSVNGTTVATTADTHNAAATYMGWAAGAGAAARFDDMAVTTPPPAPDLGVGVAAASSAATGAPVSWTATVKNNGTRTATTSNVGLSLSAALANAGVTSSTGTCIGAGTSWTCALGDRAVNSTATITLSATAPSTTATLTLTATAASAEEDANPADNSASAAISVRAPPPPGSVVIDGFDRPDAPTLGSTETGQAWATWQGSGRVVAGTAEAPGGEYTLAVVDSTTAVGRASVTVSTLSGEFWLIVRASTTGNYWRFGRWQGGTYQLQQVRSSALGAPAVTTAATVTPAVGDRLSCQLGTGLSCSVNGTTVATTADTHNAAATYMGWAAGAGAAARFDDMAVTTPPPAPDLGVGVAAASSAATGAPVSWTVTVKNNGTRTATTSTVGLSLSAALANAGVTSSTGTCIGAGTSWTCALGDRAVNSTATITLSATAPSTTATLTLTATAASAEEDANPADNSASAAISVRAPPPPGSVVIDGFDRPDAPTLGSTETGQAWATWQGSGRVVAGTAEAPGGEYTLAVVDSTTAVGRASVTVSTLSGEFWLIVRASTTGNYWRFGRWQGGTYQLQQVRSSALGAPAVTTAATVTPAAGDRLSCQLGTGLSCSVNGTTVATTADTHNAAATYMGWAAGAGAAARFDDMAVTTPPPAPDLGVGVAAASSAATGAPVSWTVTVNNNGTRTATTSTVGLSLSAALANAGVTSSTGTCIGAGTSWTCALGDRAVNSTATITLNATAPSTTATLTLTATAASAEEDANPADNSASAAISVRAPPPPGSVVIDGFDRPDAPTLGSTETGQAWATWQGGFGVSNRTAAPSSSGTNIVTLDPGWQFGTFEVTIASGAAHPFSVVLRGADAANHFRIGRDASGFYRMWKVVNGAVRDPQYLIVRADVVPRDGDVIRINNRPDDGIYVAVNGRHVMDGGDVDLLTKYRFGLAASSPLVRFDSVWISQTISSGTTTVDGFNDADGVAINQADSGTKYSWRMQVGEWVTQSGQARLQSPGYGVAWMDTSSELANAKVKVPVAQREAWLIFRYDEDGSHLRCGRSAGGNYAVERVADDHSDPIAGVTVVQRQAQANDVIEVRQGLDGRIDCLVGGTLLASFRDTSYNVRTTAYGISGDGGALFDDFTVTAK